MRGPRHPWLCRRLRVPHPSADWLPIDNGAGPAFPRASLAAGAKPPPPIGESEWLSVAGAAWSCPPGHRPALSAGGSAGPVLPAAAWRHLPKVRERERAWRGAAFLRRGVGSPQSRGFVARAAASAGPREGSARSLFWLPGPGRGRGQGRLRQPCAGEGAERSCHKCPSCGARAAPAAYRGVRWNPPVLPSPASLPWAVPPVPQVPCAGRTLAFLALRSSAVAVIPGGGRAARPRWWRAAVVGFTPASKRDPNQRGSPVCGRGSSVTYMAAVRSALLPSQPLCLLCR